MEDDSAVAAAAAEALPDVKQSLDFEKICRLCCEERFRMRTILATEGDYALGKIFSELLRIEVRARGEGVACFFVIEYFCFCF